MNTVIKTQLIYYVQKSTTAVGFFMAFVSTVFTSCTDKYGFLFITSVFAVVTILCDQIITRFFKITEDSDWLKNKELTAIQQFFNNRRTYRLVGAAALCVCWLVPPIFWLIAPCVYVVSYGLTTHHFIKKGWETHIKITPRSCNIQQDWHNESICRDSSSCCIGSAGPGQDNTWSDWEFYNR